MARKIFFELLGKRTFSLDLKLNMLCSFDLKKINKKIY